MNQTKIKRYNSKRLRNVQWQYLLNIRFDRWNETSNKFTWYKRRRSWKIVGTQKKDWFHWISVWPISTSNVSSLNIYTKLWHCIVPEKPEFLKTRKAEGSREKTHMYINITVSLFNVSLVLFKLFNITVLFAYIQQD